MTLYIDTSKNNLIYLALKKDNELILEKKITAQYSQAEKLLPGIDKLLKSANSDITKIKKIIVVNSGEGFTALRVGIITANALSFALNISVFSSDDKQIKSDYDFNIIKPKYKKEPNITVPKNNN
ncbi:hypothetical protein KAI65_00800 [Candidatus Parcubacteria bacterium]|nr:hypothetical protein [Candidatus Parcubacteria bacterium]